ncbi:MAG TPA: ribose 5-phosphate isomerase B [Actinomycetota bacterium]|nr:ribose 5-phosphate isomerase B [Actinomycetota bacterium]
MKVAIASDHAGFALKSDLIAYLKEAGHEVSDFGTDSEQSVDYPAFCAAAARAVARGEADRGIVLGGSGQGEQISANKVHGIRAALCNELWTARLCRLHNDANVLAMGARIVTTHMAHEIVDLFLNTEFEGGRHQPRLDQVRQIEREECEAARGG